MKTKPNIPEKFPVSISELKAGTDKAQSYGAKDKVAGVRAMIAGGRGGSLWDLHPLPGGPQICFFY